MRKNTGMLFRTAGIILLILTGCNQGGNEGIFTVRIEKEAVAENIGVEEESRTEKIKIPKNWTKQTKTFSDSELNDTQISQYTDETGNVVGYEVVQGEIPRYHWNNDEEFLYEAVLSEEEKKDMSTTVNLIGRVDVENYAEYKDFLPFGGEAEWALPEAYSFISDGANISLEQAMDLCMEILVLEGVKKENIKRVMGGDQYGMYVGYSFNLRNWQRDYGDTTDIVWVDNCIGVKADSIINDGMKMNIVLYERHRSELDESYNHTAATGQYLIGLKEKVIIVE